jgi:hypothetical protein
MTIRLPPSGLAKNIILDSIDQDWQVTSEPVRKYIMELEDTIALLLYKVKELEKRTEKLESKTNQNSQNSSEPPPSPTTLPSFPLLVDAIDSFSKEQKPNLDWL